MGFARCIPMKDDTVVLSRSLKDRLNILLAVVAGALAVLVGATARDTLTPDTSAPPTVAPLDAPTAPTTAAPVLRTPEPRRDDRNGKGGKGRD